MDWERGWRTSSRSSWKTCSGLPSHVPCSGLARAAMADSLDYAEELLRFTDWLAAHGPRGITESAYEYWLMRAGWMERGGCAAEAKRLTGPIQMPSPQLPLPPSTTTP